MPANLAESVGKLVNQQRDDLVHLRRHLHQYPELSGEEFETTNTLIDSLRRLPFEFRHGPNGTGLIADLVCNPDSDRFVALRADIDALAIDDAKDVAYRSQNPGVMHACGHDAHATILVGALTALSKSLDSESPFNIRGIFQPAEETAMGAGQMIESGALHNVDAIFAIHVDPNRPVGQIGLCSGQLTANCDEVLVSIRGKGGHAARPHETCDPIATACQFVSTVYGMINRVSDSRNAVVLTFGRFRGGTRSNVVPDQVEIAGSLRTLNADSRRVAMDALVRMARGISDTTQTQIRVDFGVHLPAVVNDVELFNLVRQCANQVVGEHAVSLIDLPSLGGEDFSFYAQQIPGFMLRLGSGSSGENRWPLHNSLFDIDEESIAIGAKILANCALEFRSQSADQQFIRIG